jgi:hypothetical protein
MARNPLREFTKTLRLRIDRALESSDRHLVIIAGVDDDRLWIGDQRVPVGRRDIGPCPMQRVDALDAHGDDLALQPDLHAVERHLGGDTVFDLQTGEFRHRLQPADEFGDRLFAAGHGAVDAFRGKQQRALDAAAAAESGERRAQFLESRKPAEPVEGGDAKAWICGRSVHGRVDKSQMRAIQGTDLSA